MQLQYIRGVLIIALLSVATLSCLMPSVSGNMVAPPDALVVLHVEQNGASYTGDLGYVLKCYGRTTKAITPEEYLRNGTRIIPGPYRLVYSVNHGNDYAGNYWDSHSKSCQLNGSSKIEEYCDIAYTSFWDMDHIEICQLSGSAEAGTFVIWNATDKPFFKKPGEGDSWPRYYVFSFTMPPDDQLQPRATPEGSAVRGSGLVQSIWCSIIQFLGGRCE